MVAPDRIYFDNAATSWPKPECVYEAVDRFQRELGAPAGRGVYEEAVEVERVVARARSTLARLIGARDPARIAFTANCTLALNMAIHGLLRHGDHVVTTAVEHNSVLRPLRQLENAGVITVARVGCDPRGVVDPDDLRSSLTSHTRMVIVSHASNVTGAIQPIDEIGRIARRQGAAFLVDAAQTTGHLPLDVERLGIDLLAASGHKGLLGPLGTGFLYVGSDVEKKLAPLWQGGTGTNSELDRQPDSLPDKYEAGNLNVPGLFGLDAALQYLDSRGIQEIAQEQTRLMHALWTRLEQIEGLTLFGPSDARQRVGVLSLTLNGYNPQELAALLDTGYRIQCRAGLHCAPAMHQALGTLAGGGTLRLSLGPFNTKAQIDRFIDAVSEVAGASAI